jgi:hypothetical protein
VLESVGNKDNEISFVSECYFPTNDVLMIYVDIFRIQYVLIFPKDSFFKYGQEDWKSS